MGVRRDHRSRGRRRSAGTSLAITVAALSAALARAFQAAPAPRTAPSLSSRGDKTCGASLFAFSWLPAGHESHVLERRARLRNRADIKRGRDPRTSALCEVVCEMSSSRDALSGGDVPTGVGIMLAGRVKSRQRATFALNDRMWCSWCSSGSRRTLVQRLCPSAGHEPLPRRGSAREGGDTEQTEAPQALYGFDEGAVPAAVDLGINSDGGSDHGNGCDSPVEANDGCSRNVRGRKKARYWLDDNNVRNELDAFWREQGIDSDKVPNQTLLLYFGGHGLRHGINLRGGREETAQLLGVESIPGKWREALLTREVKQLLESGRIAPDHVKGTARGGTSLVMSVRKSHRHQSELDRGFVEASKKYEARGHVRSYWNVEENFRRELLSFNTEFQNRAGLPRVWMARMTDMNKAGRRDLANAINRNGGYEAAAERLGMVPFLEWRTFLDQLEALRELREYLTVDGVLTKDMPTPHVMRADGRHGLANAIRKLGGQKMVAGKMGLNGFKPGSIAQMRSQYEDGLKFGRFDLTFAVETLEVVLQQECSRSPAPLRTGERPKDVRAKIRFKPPAIMLPRKDALLTGGERLAALVPQIEYYGGYENVARRLNLGYHFDDEAAFHQKIEKTLRDRNAKRRELREKIDELQRQKIDSYRQLSSLFERRNS